MYVFCASRNPQQVAAQPNLIGECSLDTSDRTALPTVCAIEHPSREVISGFNVFIVEIVNTNSR